MTSAFVANIEAKLGSIGSEIKAVLTAAEPGLQSMTIEGIVAAVGLLIGKLPATQIKAAVALLPYGYTSTEVATIFGIATTILTELRAELTAAAAAPPAPAPLPVVTGSPAPAAILSPPAATA